MHGSREREEAAIRRDCDLEDCGEKDCGAVGLFGESEGCVRKALPRAPRNYVRGAVCQGIHRGEENGEKLVTGGLTPGRNPVYLPMAGLVWPAGALQGIHGRVCGKLIQIL